MTLKRKIVRLLDRPGGRRLLALLGTWYARGATGVDSEVLFDQVWIHRVGRFYFADSVAFNYTAPAIRRWNTTVEAFFRDTKDHWCHLYTPRPGDIVVDVGAGIGEETLAFSGLVGENGRVLAIEAHPVTSLLLRKLCEWNELANVLVCCCAVMDHQRTVFIENQAGHVLNSVSLSPQVELSSSRVAARPLDEICDDYGIEHIDLLKMNIEGAERFAIDGMTAIIKKTRYVCIACHDFLAESRERESTFRTRDRIIAFLKGNNFEVVTRDDDERSYVRDHVHAFRPA